MAREPREGLRARSVQRSLVLKVAALGAVVGAVISIWSMRMLEALLYDVAANDLVTVVVVCLGVVLLGVTAAVPPALRATRADTSTALRAA